MFVYSPIEYVELVVGRLLSSCCLTHQGMMKHQTAKVVRRGLLLKKFLRNSELTLHQRIHFDERQFECDTCKKRFKTKPRLYAHEKIHSNSKPYKCEKCEKRFIVLAKKKRHERQVHREEK